MNRYFVPAVLAFAISGLAVMIIGVIVARSPYTHGNLSSPEGYTRTKVAYLGETYLFEGIPLAKPAEAQTGDSVHDGGLLFFRYGCAACHGSGGGGERSAGPTDASATRSGRSGYPRPCLALR
jgi:hypothetical protein